MKLVKTPFDSRVVADSNGGTYYATTQLYICHPPTFNSGWQFIYQLHGFD